MKMRQSIVWAFAVALLAGAAAPSVSFAAPGDHPGRQGPGERGQGARAIEVIDRAAHADTVKLDDEQKTKVAEIIKDATEQAKTLQEANRAARAGGDKADKDDKKAAKGTIAELATQTKERVEALLTDAQKTAFRAALAEERAKAKAERGDKPAGGGKKGNGDKKPA